MSLELLEKMCQQYSLGRLVSQPVPLKGGFLHQMYSLFTEKGKYAVKLLNPHIMQRETAMENYRIAERLETVLEENKVPILPALTIHSKKMQNIDGQFFYLYEWYDGKALKNCEIKEFHCRRIGKLLAWIHGLDRRIEPYDGGEIHVDWDDYIRQFESKDQELYKLLKENRSLLYESQEKGNAAVKRLPQVVSICHNDMDNKNVLWAGEECRIIDLECLGYASPFVELYEMALCWSGYADRQMDDHLFQCLIQSYAEAGGQLPADWETLYWSDYGRLNWLEYNIKRALGIECSAEEIEMGISEVRNTIAQAVYYDSVKDRIFNLRNALIK